MYEIPPYRRFSRKRRPNRPKKKPSFPPACDSDMTFQECELAVLRQAIDEIESNAKNTNVNSEEVGQMIAIVEKFLQDTQCICYGGTAINNILPEESQFYDRSTEIPDYDFFSKTPVEHAKKLADIFYREGYTEVEAKAGIHYGTYKVFVNFIPMADITLLHEDLFDNLKADAIMVDQVLYTPPNFLRMSMFLELSRPNGDVSRWEKVLKRLTLLNQHYPLKGHDCHKIDFQRSMETKTRDESESLYYLIRDTFIAQRVVFFGGYASSLYAKYMPYDRKHFAKTIPDFDVLSEDAHLCATIVVQSLQDAGYTKTKIVAHDAIGEVIPARYEILVDKETLAFVYEPIACHNYNEIHVDGQSIRVATIDTILSFYLAFLYANDVFHTDYKDRLLCMSQYLFDVEQKNRLNQMGVLKRFSLSCYGKQPTLETIRAEKAEMFRKLKKKRGMQWDRWFLKYNPREMGTKRTKKSPVDVNELKKGQTKNGQTKKEKPKKEQLKRGRKTRAKAQKWRIPLQKKSDFLFS